MPEELELEVADIDQIPDPGKMEGQKKDPKIAQEAITAEAPRFKEVYAKLKEAERKIERLEASGGNKDLIEEMKRHNQQLEEAIKGKNSDTDIDSGLKSLEDKLTELRTLKKAAREAADFDKETDVDDKIADLKLDIRDFKKEIEKNKTVSKEKIDPSDNLSDDEKEEYKTWIDENKWFSKDNKRRASAIVFEKKVIAEPEFKDASISEILEEVRIRVEEKFKPVEGINSVESGGSRFNSGSTSSHTVKLSATELSIANGLGVRPEEFAKQKVLINKGRR